MGQRQSDRSFKPVYYASRALSDVERRYSQMEKEALAIVWACEKFHVFFYGKEFVMVTDHKPLETIYSPKSKPPARIERWVLRMQPYQFKVVYKPGSQNAVDSLSRLTVNPPPSPVVGEEHVYYVAKHAVPQAFTPRELEEMSAADTTLAVLRKCIMSADWKSCSSEFMRVEELSCIGHVILRGTCIVKPRAARQRTLMLAHERHQDRHALKNRSNHAKRITSKTMASRSCRHVWAVPIRREFACHNRLLLKVKGEVEWQNRTLCKAIRTAHAEGKDWLKVLYTFLLAYRSTPHSVMGRSPADLLFNRQIHTKLPQLPSTTQQGSEAWDSAVQLTDAV
ncbi:hypothetical protein SKAU_G00131590 [Synaphobranchus kaupii]|uniref:Reverse transcriptase RNase H-like domain-containing protein n=1 Tax=Synaphobranchus kaupii TaxID=118154 RepID=A0A9Q1FRJ7_SYNKA|nr:hypothetical protein SKAU_G00131590 [Synaphobranchus kaupii]